MQAMFRGRFAVRPTAVGQMQPQPASVQNQSNFPWKTALALGLGWVAISHWGKKRPATISRHMTLREPTAIGRMPTGVAEKLDALIEKYMRILNIKGAKPAVRLRDNLGSRWLGRDIWRGSEPTTTVMELQRSLLADDRELERVIAHEMVHHRDFLALSGSEIAMLRLGIRTPGHGDSFLRGAAIINAEMGNDFVTVKSDYAPISTGKKFYMLIAPIPGDRLGYAWGQRPSQRGMMWIQNKVAAGAKLIETTDISWTNGVRIGDKGLLSVPTKPDRAAALRDLYDNAPPLAVRAAQPAA